MKVAYLIILSLIFCITVQEGAKDIAEGGGGGDGVSSNGVEKKGMSCRDHCRRGVGKDFDNCMKECDKEEIMISAIVGTLFGCLFCGFVILGIFKCFEDEIKICCCGWIVEKKRKSLFIKKLKIKRSNKLSLSALLSKLKNCGWKILYRQQTAEFQSQIDSFSGKLIEDDSKI